MFQSKDFKLLYTQSRAPVQSRNSVRTRTCAERNDGVGQLSEHDENNLLYVLLNIPQEFLF